MFNINGGAGQQGHAHPNQPFLPPSDLPMPGQQQPPPGDMARRTLAGDLSRPPAQAADYFNPWYGGAGRAPPLDAMGGARQPLPAFDPIAGQNSQAATPNDKKKTKRRPEGESPSAADEKRTKTGRACDACRSKKIRCDILTSDNNDANAKPICAHCKQYGIECTFFLPITETRFKKRRAAADDPTPKPEGATSGHQSRPSGAASIPFLVHNDSPTRSFEQFDVANHMYWEISEDDSGRIRIDVANDVDEDHGHVAKYVLPPSVMSSLVNSFFNHDHEIFPIVSKSDFVASGKPYPLLLYSMCAITATRRDFPRHVFYRLRGLVNGLMRSNEIMSHAKLEHVQALLIMAMSGELSAQPTAPTASAAMLRLTAAIRMAQDLGLHRESQTTHSQEEVELRRRVWAACVIFDRWYCASLGLPLIIDVHDCDVRLPSPFVLRDGVPVIEPTFEALAENLRLSLIMGRVLKEVYGPTGLQRATDEQLETILGDLKNWRESLPDNLKFTGPDSPLLAGLLHMEFVAIQFLFWRGFLRVTSSPPAHLKLILDTGRWGEVVEWAREGVEWLNAHDTALDSLYIFPYTATSCALVQYHTWARRRDPGALETLKLVRDLVARWEASVQLDQMSIRRKSCETMTLLYEAALKTTADPDDRTDRSEGTPASSTSQAGRPTGANTTSAGSTASDGPVPAFGRRHNGQLDQHVQSDGPHLIQYSLAPDESAAMNLDDNDCDVAFLDNLPDSNFDWPGWGNYFDTVNRMFPGQTGNGDGDDGEEAES